MTENLPDYATVKVPDGKVPKEYTHHERRADLLRRCIEAGSPFAINQSEQADRYGVSRVTVCRDMKRLRESVDDALGDDAKLTARAVFEHTLNDLQAAEDWRASKAAFDAVMDWQNWLAELGEQHREPDRSELDLDVRSRHAEVAYRVVRDGDGDAAELPTTEDGAVDHDALGFSDGPADVPVAIGGETGGDADP
jgi:hypothetical protein